MRIVVKIAGLSVFQYPTTVVKIVMSKHASAAWKKASINGGIRADYKIERVDDEVIEKKRGVHQKHNNQIANGRQHVMLLLDGRD